MIPREVRRPLVALGVVIVPVSVLYWAGYVVTIVGVMRALERFDEHIGRHQTLT